MSRNTLAHYLGKDYLFGLAQSRLFSCQTNCEYVQMLRLMKATSDLGHEEAR